MVTDTEDEFSLCLLHDLSKALYFLAKAMVISTFGQCDHPAKKVFAAKYPRTLLLLDVVVGTGELEAWRPSDNDCRRVNVQNPKIVFHLQAHLSPIPNTRPAPAGH